MWPQQQHHHHPRQHMVALVLSSRSIRMRRIILISAFVLVATHVVWMKHALLERHSSVFSSNDRPHTEGRIDLPPPPPRQKQNNRTLVIVMGNLRGGELAWETLYRNVLDVNKADLALLLGRTPEKKSSMYARARYLWEFDEYDDWGDALDLINGTTWRQRVPHYLHDRSSILGGVRNYNHWEGSGAIIFMFRWFLTQRLREENLVERYDTFIITRSDHYYLCAHDIRQFDMDYLWLPAGQDNKGVTDRHLVVSNKLVLAALNILPPLLEHPEAYKKLLARRSGNPEKMIRNRWQRDGLWDKIRRFDRMMFTCAQPGDMTRWKKMSDAVVPEGVHLKYLLEYNASHATCDR